MRIPSASALRVVAILGVALAAVPTARAQTTYSWSGTSGNWNQDSSWTPAGGPPTAIDSALLGGSGTYTANLTDDQAITNLTLNNAGATLSHGNGGVLSVGGTVTLTAGTYALKGGIISGGSITTGGGTGKLVVSNNSNNELRDVQIGNGVLGFATGGGSVVLTGTSNFAADTVLDMPDNATVVLRETVTLDQMTVNMAGTSTTSTSRLALEGAGNVLTLGPKFTLRNTAASAFNEINTVDGAVTIRNGGLIENVGSGRLSITQVNTAPLTFVNQSGGVLRATAGTLSIAGESVTNEAGGLIEAAGGTVRMGGDWSNAGTFRVQSGTLQLGGTFTTAGIGTLERTGGTVELVGALNNSGATLALTAGTGNFTLAGGSITGGSLTSDGTARLRIGPNQVNNRLTDVAIGVGVLEFVSTGGRVQMTGTTTLATGTVLDLSVHNSIVGFAQTRTLDNLTVNLSGDATRLTVEGTNTLTLGPNTTVYANRSVAGSISSVASRWFTTGVAGTIVNQGTIRAEGLAKVEVNPDTFTNTGTLEADGGTVAVLTGAFQGGTVNFTNFSAGTLTGGTYVARNGGTLDLGGRAVTRIGAGTTVELNGAASTFAALNTLTTNAGTLRIRGGQSLNPADTTTITNTGTIEVGAGSTLTSNLTVNGGGVLTGGGATAGTVVGNVTFDTTGGTLAPGSSPGLLAVTGDVVLNGNTTFAVELNGAAAGTGHDRLTVTGAVDLGGAILAATLGYTPSAGDQLVIIDNDGTDLVVGQFADLGQGASFPIDGQMAFIDYRGGTGNDVVIQFTPVPEPAGLLAAAGLVAAAVGYRRRR